MQSFVVSIAERGSSNKPVSLWFLFLVPTVLIDYGLLVLQGRHFGIGEKSWEKGVLARPTAVRRKQCRGKQSLRIDRVTLTANA